MYPEIEPYHSDWLKVDDLHEIYFEESGDPKGVPVLFVHGGPGAGTKPKHRQYFDPAHYRIILVDQRGCGKSRPFGELQNNTTLHLVEDFEKLREYLKIDAWVLFGGSWGSTLALSYAITHPERVLGLVVWGIFLGRPEEYDWMLRQAWRIFPQYYEPFIEYLPEEERADPLKAYAKRILGSDPAVAAEAARRWCLYETQCCTFMETPEILESWEKLDVNVAIAKLGTHYCINECFLPPEGLLKGVEKIHHLPIHIVQSRYDMVCPMGSAYELQKRLPKATLTIVQDAGHSGSDPSLAQALIAATDRFRELKLKKGS